MLKLPFLEWFKHFEEYTCPRSQKDPIIFFGKEMKEMRPGNLLVVPGWYFGPRKLSLWKHFSQQTFHKRWKYYNVTVMLPGSAVQLDSGYKSSWIRPLPILEMWTLFQ